MIKPQQRVPPRPIAIRRNTPVPRERRLRIVISRRIRVQKGQLLVLQQRTGISLSTRASKALQLEQPHPIAIRHNIPASKGPRPEQRWRIVISLSTQEPKALQPARRWPIAISQSFRALKAQRSERVRLIRPHPHYRVYRVLPWVRRQRTRVNLRFLERKGLQSAAPL
jgi:hypothetical protein